MFHVYLGGAEEQLGSASSSVHVWSWLDLKNKFQDVVNVFLNVSDVSTMQSMMYLQTESLKSRV